MEESTQAWLIFLKHLVTLDSEEFFLCSNFAPLKGQPTKNTHHFGVFSPSFPGREMSKKDKDSRIQQPSPLPAAAVQDRLIFFFRAIFFFRSTRGWSWRVRRGDWCLGPGMKGSC